MVSHARKSVEMVGHARENVQMVRHARKSVQMVGHALKGVPNRCYDAKVTNSGLRAQKCADSGPNGLMGFEPERRRRKISLDAR